MKFYAVVFGNWQGISNKDVDKVFYNKEAAENYCEHCNDYDCDPDEWYEVQEWDEELVKEFWGDRQIA